MSTPACLPDITGRLFRGDQMARRSTACPSIIARPAATKLPALSEMPALSETDRASRLRGEDRWLDGQLRIPTAREMIRPIVTNEIRACVLISALACVE